MPRPKKCRKVCCMPKYDEFIPARKNHENEEPIILSIDEYEAIRLIDNENLSQEECSKQMNVARTTIQQIYTIARRKIAKALVNGNRLLIQGGDYTICEGVNQNCNHSGCPKLRNCKMKEHHRNKEAGKMKIIIPLDENKSDVCEVFARTPYFLLFDEKSGEQIILDNPATNEESAAGLKAAQFILDTEADVLITVRCGENSARVLKAGDVEIYKALSKDALQNTEEFKQGKLEILNHFHSGYHGIQ